MIFGIPKPTKPADFASECNSQRRLGAPCVTWPTFAQIRDRKPHVASSRALSLRFRPTFAPTPGQTRTAQTGERRVTRRRPRCFDAGPETELFKAGRWAAVTRVQLHVPPRPHTRRTPHRAPGMRGDPTRQSASARPPGSQEMATRTRDEPHKYTRLPRWFLHDDASY